MTDTAHQLLRTASIIAIAVVLLWAKLDGWGG